MEHRQLKGARTAVCRLEKGSDAIGELKRLAGKEGIGSGFFTLIGASQSAKLSYFDQGCKRYATFSVAEPCEILSCTGNIILRDGAPFVHAHAVLGRSDGSTVGGHVESLLVYAGEAHLTFSKGRIERAYDDETGLHLMRLEKGAKRE